VRTPGPCDPAPAPALLPLTGLCTPQRKSTVILISVVSTIVVYSTVVSFLVSAVRYNAAYSGKSWFSKLGSGDVGAAGATGTNLAAAAPPMPPAPSNDGPTEFTTRSQCASMGSWGDVCVYEDVCFDGTHWLFVDPSLPSGNLRQTFSLTSVLPGRCGCVCFFHVLGPCALVWVCRGTHDVGG
jgi:hypothetical protein